MTLQDIPPTPSSDGPTGAGEDVSARQRWMGILARASAREIEARLTSLAAETVPAYEPVRAAETGMVMVQGRAGGTGARFNAGEMTVTRCSVVLADGTVGHAYVAGRDPRHAELAAVLDGMLLSDPATRDTVLSSVVDPLAQDQADARDLRARQAAATKVDFFTMVRGED